MTRQRQRPPFGTWLHQRRRIAGLTQAELAAEMGREPTYITRWETKNQGIPAAEDLMLMIQILGTTYEEFAEAMGIPMRSAQADAQVPVLTRVKAEIRGSTELSRELKDIIIDTLEFAERRAERMKDAKG